MQYLHGTATAMWATLLLLLLALGVLALGLVAHRLLSPAGNPFARPPTDPPRPLVMDQRARDRVLKRGEWGRTVCLSVRLSVPGGCMLCAEWMQRGAALCPHPPQFAQGSAPRVCRGTWTPWSSAVA